MTTNWVVIAAYAAAIFFSGFGWGKFLAERSIRKEQAELHKRRVVVSMPMREENASQMLGLLRDLLREAEEKEAGHE